MRGIKIYVLLWLLATAVESGPQAMRSPIFLEIPQLHAVIDGNSASVISTADFDTFFVHLGKSSSQVEYGSITSKINTESANIVMTTMSTADGIVCKFDLSRLAGFKLRPGRNSIEIAFHDRWKRLSYASFLLQVGSRPEGARPFKSSPPERLTAEKYAVIVGVAKYKNSTGGLSNLRFADRDAMSFYDFLLSPQGGSFKRENVKLLLNEDATSQNLRSALFTFLTKPREQDLVLLYFAGHGSPDPNDKRNLYLLTYDTQLDDMGGTAFPMWQLQDVFVRIIKAKRVITFTDSCHSYGVSGQLYGGSEKSNNLINQYLAAYAASADRAVITASDVSELSAEAEKWGGGHGVFTYFVLRGLQGDGDLNRDGTVTAGELFQYVRDQVQKETDFQQTPIAMPGLANALPLAGLQSTASRRAVDKPNKYFGR
jgi:hypothetical protein